MAAAGRLHCGPPGAFNCPMFKKTLVILGIVGAVLVIIGFILPRTAHVERTLVIDRPPSVLFATVNSFQLFPQWSPWQMLDPHMHQSTQGPREGVGAKLIWSGNDKVGTGTQTITASAVNGFVASDLDFGKMGVAKSKITLAPEAPGTRVTWALDSDMGASPIGHYFGLLMDGMIGKDFETGLSRLKTLTERMPNVDIAGFQAELVDMRSVPVLVVSESTSTDAPSISKAYAEGYGKISHFMAKNQLHQAGAPFGIDGGINGASFAFQAGIPIDRGDMPGDGTVLVAQSYGGKALKTTHTGPYDTLAKTYDKFRAYLIAHAYTPAGGAISWYVDDPATTAADKLRTEIYWPIR